MPETTTTATTPGFRTFGFYVALLLTGLSAFTASGSIPEAGAVGQVLGLLVSAGTAIGYTGWRVFKKGEFGTGKAFWLKSEFLLTAASILTGALMASGVFPATGIAMKVIGGVMAILAGLGYKNPIGAKK